MIRLCQTVTLAVLLSLVIPVNAADALRVGMSADYPPLHYQSEGEVVGVEPDSARAVAEIPGKSLSIFVFEFSDLPQALKQGRIDVICQASVSPESADNTCVLPIPI